MKSAEHPDAAADLVQRVRKAAETLGLLDVGGELMAMDSLMIIDFVVAVEEDLGIRIPMDRLQPESFLSIEAVVRTIGALQTMTR